MLDIIRFMLMIWYGKYCWDYLENMGESAFTIPIDKIFIVIIMVILWQFIYIFIQLIYNGLNDR